MGCLVSMSAHYSPGERIVFSRPQGALRETEALSSESNYSLTEPPRYLVCSRQGWWPYAYRIRPASCWLLLVPASPHEAGGVRSERATVHSVMLM
eukprot:2547170-Pyramimonas_sp.AAC.1